jgi:hypothetical protein
MYTHRCMKNTPECAWKKKQQSKMKWTYSLVVGVKKYMKRLKKVSVDQNVRTKRATEATYYGAIPVSVYRE